MIRGLIGLALGVLVLLFLALGAWIYFEAWMRAPDLVRARFAEAGTRLSASDVPPEWIVALLAVEDPDFRAHGGVDFSTPGAGLTTITQALCKDLFFDDFRPGLAKIEQTIDAMALDRRVDKDTQLDLFLSTVYLGEGPEGEVHGFAEAARVYYGMAFADLKRAEFLSLVAMAIGPADYHVIARPDRNARRVRRIERLLRGECRPAGLTDVTYRDCGDRAKP